MVHLAGETVLITGATGFIGGNLAARLVAIGADVVVIERDRQPVNTLSALGVQSRVTTISGDITNLTFMQRAFAEYNVGYAFHFAAQTSISAAVREPISTFDTNIRGTWITLEAARVTSSLKGIVVAASDRTYGLHLTGPYTETVATIERYPYGASKACSSIIAQCYYTTYGLPIAVTQNVNTYGQGDLNFSRLVSGAIRTGLANRTLRLRSSGDIRRDYLHVDDAVDGYLTLMEALNRGVGLGRTFCFGTGLSYSVMDVCNTIVRLTGSTSRLEIGGDNPAEAADLLPEIRRTQAELQWQPEKPLELGLQETVAWYRDFLARGSV